MFNPEPCKLEVYTAAWRSGSLDARAQLVVPSPAPIEYVVGVVGGGLVGHAAFALDIWWPMCARFRCALAHFDVASDPPPATRAHDPGRNATVGSGQALLSLLDTLARSARRPELSRAKLALFGFSATGSFALTFAVQYPERTLTAVRYHSHLRGLEVDTMALARVPVLMVASTGDSTAGVEDTRSLWQRGRRSGAPWALAVETGRAHVSLDSWLDASDLIWHWIEAIGSPRTRAGYANGWHGDPDTRTIARVRVGVSDEKRSWLPDSVTAESWRRLNRGQP